VILVPTDFTEVAECATSHALKMTELSGGTVTLLHVVDNASEVDAAEERLRGVAQNLNTRSKQPINYVVKEGNIFDDIGDVAISEGANLIVMGTHGKKGLQHITGSYALKVVTKSDTPFVVVQKKPPKAGYGKIVMPVRMSQKSKHKLPLVLEIAQAFKSKIYLVSPREGDDFIMQKVKRNLQQAINFMAENSIECDYEIVTKKGGFALQTAEYAKKIDADMISIVNIRDKDFPEFISGLYEQDLITNTHGIPVMIVNPKQGMFKTGSVMI